MGQTEVLASGVTLGAFPEAMGRDVEAQDPGGTGPRTRNMGNTGKLEVVLEHIND